jgi:hypothetical protein
MKRDYKFFLFCGDFPVEDVKVIFGRFVDEESNFTV